MGLWLRFKQGNGRWDENWRWWGRMSTLNRASVRFAEAHGWPWFVLSAKHWVVHPDTPLDPYDVALGRLRHRTDVHVGACTERELASQWRVHHHEGRLMRHAIHRVGSQRDAETIARAVFAHAPTAVRIVRRHRYDAYGYRVGVGYVVAFQDHSTHEWLWDHPCRPTPLSRRLHALSPDVFMIYLAWFEAGTRSVADCMQWVAQARHQRKQ